jgi:hypothetical protein
MFTRPAVRQVRSGKLPGSLVLAVVEATQLPVTGNANCLQTESAGQPLLLGLTGRAESPGPVPLWVEMVPPGGYTGLCGTRDQEGDTKPIRLRMSGRHTP